MYGDDKKWLELMTETKSFIDEAREERGAGRKCEMVPFDPAYICHKSGAYLKDEENDRQILSDITNSISKN